MILTSACRLRSCGVVLLCLFLVAGSGRARGREEAGVLEQARAAVDAGCFHDAEALLHSHIMECDAPITDPLSIELEIIRRIRLDYSLTPADLLAKLGSSIPEVTAQDIDRWREQRHLQHRVIDGEIRYFKRAADNLFRFCEEARKRRADANRPAPAGWKFSLPDHVQRIVEAAAAAKSPFVFPVRHRVWYRLAVKEGNPRLKSGANIRCWLPFPQEYRQQREVRLISARPEGYVIAPSGEGQRTICFEETATESGTPPVFEAAFEFVTSAYCPDLDPAGVQPYDRESQLYRTFTAERPPHIVFTPRIEQVVAEVAGSQSNPLLRARELFLWVCENVRYCSEMEYSTIRNLSDKAMATRQGDCGVQGMLLITLCRAAGIPARWQSGWETKPNNWNMHDWAEFYVEPWGWLPADPSYGLQEHEDRRVREFYFGHTDPYRLIVNLDYGSALVPPKTSFRSEPNDFQRGEIEIDGQNLYFDQWSWEFKLRTVPLAKDFVALEEALDAVVPDLLTEGKMAGAVLLVGKKEGDGFRTWQKAYGYKQILPHPEPMPVDALFDLASLTKPIATGTSLMILADEGKISPDDPVGKYLPEFETGDKREVTVRHLMTHMSGEKPYVGADDQNKIKADAGFPCRDAVRDYIRHLDLIRRPGDTMQYSCLNAILSAEIVRMVSGMELSDFAAQRIFEPLGMNDTRFRPSEAIGSRLVPTTQSDHGRGPGGFLLGQVHDPLAAMQGGVSGNAGLFSTAADLSRFAQMMLSGGALGGARILSPEAIEQMTSVQNPGAKNSQGSPARRGLLWDTYPPEPGAEGVDALYAYGHTGYTGTAIRLYPEQGVYVIALANRVHPDDTGKVGDFRKMVWRTVGDVLLETGE